MEESTRVGQAIRGSQSFWASVAFVQEPVRISFDLNNPIPSHSDKKAAPPVIHSGAVGPLPLNFFGHPFSFYRQNGEKCDAPSKTSYCPYSMVKGA